MFNLNNYKLYGHHYSHNEDTLVIRFKSLYFNFIIKVTIFVIKFVVVIIFTTNFIKIIIFLFIY